MSGAREEGDGRYRPIEAYGIIGDCRTAALVDDHGSIDWWCPDRFDSPSVFARILDARRGGRFLVRPVTEGARPHVAYEPHTNVLRTTWDVPGGRLSVHDLMPLQHDGEPVDKRSRILRILSCERGRVEVEVRFEPRPGYGRHACSYELDEGGARARSAEGDLWLRTRLPLSVEDGALVARVGLRGGESHALEAFAHADGDVELAPPSPLPPPLEPRAAIARLRTTRRYWTQWSSRCEYEGPYREHVVRSALALKLLTYRPTGALIAAPTTSLPEIIGGERNWDYRYAWMRDAAFAVAAFYQAGAEEDAAGLAHWIGGRMRRKDRVHVLYRVDGGDDVEERELPHLEGYRASSPVRIGNAAAQQWQLDVYGELVDALHLCRKAGEHEEEVAWEHVREVIEYVRNNWREPDDGIWEMRTQPRHFVVSKLMAWLALDDGVRAIEEMGLEGPLDEWRRARDEVRDEVLARGYDERTRSFVMAYDLRAPDAAALLIPLLGLLPARDERVVGTVERILDELTENGHVYRYRGVDDGLAGSDHSFVACTCWMIEVLAQMGRLEESKQMFEGLLARASPLGLFAEEIDASTGAHIGNYPQGLSLIGVINAAAAIALAEEAGRPGASSRRRGLLEQLAQRRA